MFNIVTRATKASLLKLGQFCLIFLKIKLNQMNLL